MLSDKEGGGTRREGEHVKGEGVGWGLCGMGGRMWMGKGALWMGALRGRWESCCEVSTEMEG